MGGSGSAPAGHEAESSALASEAGTAANGKRSCESSAEVMRYRWCGLILAHHPKEVRKVFQQERRIGMSASASKEAQKQAANALGERKNRYQNVNRRTGRCQRAQNTKDRKKTKASSETIAVCVKSQTHSLTQPELAAPSRLCLHYRMRHSNRVCAQGCWRNTANRIFCRQRRYK